MDAYLKDLQAVIASIPMQGVTLVADAILRAAQESKSVYIFGNGDSATNAFHFSADLAKTARMHNKRLKIICLNENVPLMTAWANDESYESIFSRQLENFVEKDDVVIGISTSGNSPNVLKALDVANKLGALTIALCACGGGKVMSIANQTILANTNNVEIAEDIHFIMGHMIKLYIIKKWLA